MIDENDTQMLDAIDVVMMIGAQRYLEIENGILPTDAELAKLWAGGQVGEFTFRLYARFGVWMWSRMITPDDKYLTRQQRNDKTEQYIDNLLAGIGVEFKKLDMYRNFSSEYPFFDNEGIEYSAFLYGAPIAFLVYALPEIFNKFDCEKLTDMLGVTIKDLYGFVQIIGQADPKDYHLLAKSLLYGSYSDILDSEKGSMLAQILGTQLQKQILWIEATQKITEIQMRMYTDVASKAQAYRDSGKLRVGNFFQIYAEDDTQMFMEQAIQRSWDMGSGLSPDEGLIRMQCIFDTAQYCTPETYIPEMMHVIDDTVSMFYGRFE